MKTKVQKKDFLQIRIDRAEKLGAELAQKMEKIAQANSLSLNDVANLGIAAGLGMVERKLAEMRDPEPEKQAA